MKIAHIAEAAGLSVIPHGSGGSAFGQHARRGLSAVPMIECSGPVMTEPGLPRAARAPCYPTRGTRAPRSAPGHAHAPLRP